MSRIREVRALIEQAKTGDIPPSGNLEDSDELIGFGFGLHFDARGQLASPGPVNEAMADCIVNHEVLRTKDMTLQEELAIAVESRDPRLSLQIDTLKTIKKPFQTYNTHELLMQARGGLTERGVRSLAVVAFRHHLPRAAAQVRRTGFDVRIPDLRTVGDFDPSSTQAWTQDQEAWIRRERKVILAFTLMGRI